ncbi:sentrin-specific protease 8-like [Drosophila novamexicana]|uniref:sentrin-specific protease 8-like n=1 Tax=Drosophila novamexicana TaxID=47314 RepID=UPI0011E5C7A8|nr:sentrin-specific protease 8-like [Drosophila novamexicana]
MPRNVRQKKRAERRVQAAAATAAAAADEAANENSSKLNNNTASSSNSSSSTNVVHNKKPKASRADPILASLSKNALRMSDVQLLHGPHWLNDAILNFYFAYLEEVKYKSNVDFLFVTPEMSQCMLYMDDKELHGLLVAQNQALRKPFIFMALNDSHSRDRGGAHWSLVVASRPDKSFFHFDSYGGGNTNCSLELINNIKDVLDMQHARFRGMRCLQQSNDYDCGIHVICMADQLTDYVNRYDSVDGVQPLHQDVIKAKRNQLIKLVASLGQHI